MENRRVNDSRIGTEESVDDRPLAFWSLEPQLGADFGLFHKADRKSPHFLPGVLLVFAHGINSDARACWQDRPERLLSELCVDVDILNFEYPAGLFANTSIPDAARVLHAVLSELVQRSRYKDIIFVVHSAGGLVLKQMLVLDAHVRRDILKRTRHMFNFGVPHAGSISGLSEWGRKALVFVEFVCSPVTSFVRFASMGKCNPGRNKIYIALKHNNACLSKLEADYIEVVKNMAESGQSRPESIEIRRIDTTEITGTNDPVSDAGVRYGYSSDRDRLTVRGEHSSIKYSPLSLTAICERIHAVINELWTKRCAEYDATVGHLLVQRGQIVESTTGVTKLYRDDDSSSSDSGLNQAACMKQLTRWLFGELVVGRVLVSGPVGVGKSVVLRMLCRKACQRFLSSQTDALVLFFPIDRLRVDELPEQTADQLWLAICRAWVKHTNELLKSTSLPADLPTSITLSWMLRRLEHSRTVVILDGVDEFIANHPQLTLQQFIDCLPRVRNEAIIGDLRVVLAARDTLWGLDALRQSAYHVKMGPLGIEAIRELFPGLADWLARLSDADRKILLTPLVVSALLKTHHIPQAHSATKILQEAVESVLTGNKFFEKGFTLEPLALLAWIYYRRFQRELPVAEIKKAADDLLAEWQAHITEYGSDSAASPKLLECYNNLKALSDPESLKVMLRHSFFFPTTAGSYSLSNEQWRDFLVTFYLSLCVRHKHASGLAGVALQDEHYQRAGDLLSDFQVDPELVARFVSTGKAGSDPFIVGNLASLLGMSCVPILPAAAKKMVSACGDDIHPLGRFVATGRLAGRAVKSDIRNADFSAVDLRAELSKALPGILSREDCGSVMRSLCLCYQRAFGVEGKAMPELATDDVLLSLIGDVSYQAAERFRSLQLSFLRSQYTTAAYPERSVAHVHFLFLLTLARIKGVAIPEVCEQLPALLEKGCETEAFYRKHKSIPELLSIYEQCQRLWEDYKSPAPKAA